jgi:hypothetical protein
VEPPNSLAVSGAAFSVEILAMMELKDSLGHEDSREFSGLDVVAAIDGFVECQGVIDHQSRLSLWPSLKSSQ